MSEMARRFRLWLRDHGSIWYRPPYRAYLLLEETETTRTEQVVDFGSDYDTCHRRALLWWQRNGSKVRTWNMLTVVREPWA